MSIKVVEQEFSDWVIYHYLLVNNSDQVIVGFHLGNNGGVPELSEMPMGWDSEQGIPPTSATSAHGWKAEALAQEESEYHLLQWDTSNFATASLPGQSLSGFSVTLALADSSYKTAHAQVILDDGSAYAVALELELDTAPLIVPSKQAVGVGNPSAHSQIAMVGDAQDALNTLGVTVNGGMSATVNGVTITLNPTTPHASGQVFADVVAACAATAANFTLRVTDSRGLFTEATLTVTVNPNTPPC